MICREELVPIGQKMALRWSSLVIIYKRSSVQKFVLVMRILSLP